MRPHHLCLSGISEVWRNHCGYITFVVLTVGSMLKQTVCSRRP